MYALYLAGHDRRALVRLDPVPRRSTSPARRPARPRASCSAATSRRSGRRARSSGCSASCWRPAGSTTRSTGRAAAIMSQLLVLVLINIVFGFASGGGSTTPPTSAASPPACGSARSSRRPACRRSPRCGSGRARRGRRPGRRPHRATSWCSGLAVVGIVVVGRRRRSGRTSGRLRVRTCAARPRPGRLQLAEDDLRSRLAGRAALRLEGEHRRRARGEVHPERREERALRRRSGTCPARGRPPRRRTTAGRP